MYTALQYIVEVNLVMWMDMGKCLYVKSSFLCYLKCVYVSVQCVCVFLLINKGGVFVCLF